MPVGRHSLHQRFDRGVREFDRFYQQSAESVRVIAMSVYPFLSGVPHRIRYVEEVFKNILNNPDVLFWTGEQILAMPRAPGSGCDAAVAGLHASRERSGELAAGGARSSLIGSNPSMPA